MLTTTVGQPSSAAVAGTALPGWTSAARLPAVLPDVSAAESTPVPPSHHVPVPPLDRPSREVTRLLQAHVAGEAGALDRVLAQVYDELRRIARGRLRRERADHTLSATEVVHEAYLKLMPLDQVAWQSRVQFYAVASRAMRNVLIDHAVRRGAAKRGGGEAAVSLHEEVEDRAVSIDELIALAQALERLAVLDLRQARVVEYRFLGALSLEETAEALGISSATVSRDWTFARAWLHRELAAEAPSGGVDGC